MGYLRITKEYYYMTVNAGHGSIVHKKPNQAGNMVYYIESLHSNWWRRENDET